VTDGQTDGQTDSTMPVSRADVR